MSWIKDLFQRPLWLNIILLVYILVTTILILKFIYIPWFFISINLASVGFFLVQKLKFGFVKVIFLNVVIFIGLFAPLEIIVFKFVNAKGLIKQTKNSYITDTLHMKPFLQRHTDLGWIPSPSAIFVHNESYIGSGENLSVQYTIDKNGQRISMPDDVIQNKFDESVIFFGGSFTFGEAVEDNETLPWQFGKLDNFNRRIYNFGFEGYGPNHMLANIETQRVERIVQEPPSLIIFQGIMDHLDRVIGKHAWINGGPRYIYENNIVTRQGSFDSGISISNIVLRQFLKSHVIQNLKFLVDDYMKLWLDVPKFEKKANLFVKIIVKAKNDLEEIYGEVPFVVAMWRESKFFSVKETQAILSMLRDDGITVVSVNLLLDDYINEPNKYLALPNNHPNLVAYRKIAEYLISIEPHL
jgi:hypothetical protein